MTSTPNTRTRYRVLPTPSWMRSKFGSICRSTADCLKPLERMLPVFNRPGWYYDRHTKIAWYEFEGQAWKCSRLDDFLYCMSLAHHRPLANRERTAIKTLIDMNRCPAELRSLIYLDDQWQNLRDIKTGTEKCLLSFRRKMDWSCH